jgi:mannose/fructose-specific phosphotransferase system component IIA
MEKHILLLTHGNMAVGLCSSLDVIGVDSSILHTICLQMEDSPTYIKQKIEQFMDKRPDNAIVFILTDIPFGSTTQIAFPFLTVPDVYLISGLNLGLLLGIVLEPMDKEPEIFIRDTLSKAQQTLLLANDLLKTE